ncbi:MAG: serine/threonine protein kinase [Coriobacteriia bacterium]|nr:serine/threonine protein kinase [Coriobacteriia bacterium]
MPHEICLNCFKDKGNYEVCLHCGFKEGTPPEQAYHLHPGTVLNSRYTIGTVIDFGGFGVIYKAWDTHLSKMMAIKEFFPSGIVTRAAGGTDITVYPKALESNQFQTALDRFLLEARTTVAFRESPYIVNVYNFFEENNTAYFVMEYLDGISLSDYLAQPQTGRLDYEEAFEIITSVMEGLKVIHSAGVIHRDIHPGNIFITTSNHIKIIDFGAARLSNEDDNKTLTVVITQGYTAPEQYRSKSRQGPFTDIYGLAATLYKMLTGEVPDEAPDREIKDTLQRPMDMNVLISKNADNAIMRAMAVNPDLRYQKVDDFQEALLSGKKVDDPETVLRKRMTRRSFIIGGASLLAVGGLAGLALYERYKPEPPLARTTIEDDSITVWLPVTGEEAAWDEQVYIWRQIADQFSSDMRESKGNGYPDIVVNIEPKPSDSYANEVSLASKDQSLPSIFNTESSPLSILDQAIPMDRLISTLNRDEYLFLSRYEELFADFKRLPLGFDLIALYGNENNASMGSVGTQQALPKLVPSLNALYSRQMPVSIEKSSYPLFLALYHPDLSDEKGVNINDSESLVEDLQQIALYDPQTTDISPVQLLADDKILYMIGTFGLNHIVEAFAPGQYQIISLSNESVLAGRFQNIYAISSSLSKNQQDISLLFLAYMLRNSSQNIVNVQNHQSLPINKKAFGDYVASRPGLSTLAEIDDRENDVVFFELDRPQLIQFSQEYFDKIILEDGSTDSVLDFVEQWKV